MLIEPLTATGQRLAAKWATSADRPDRHVVCYTFIRASVVNGGMLEADSMRGVKSFFRLDRQKGSGGGGDDGKGGVPVEFWLHESLQQDHRKELAVEIEVYLHFSVVR